MNYILSVDFGTSAIKSAIFGSDGGLVASVTREYPLLYGAHGVVEVRLADLEHAFWYAVKNVIVQSQVPKENIITLGFSSSAETMVFLDEFDCPLRNGITWMDTRAEQETKELIQVFTAKRIFEITGQAAMDIFYPAPKLLWLKRHEGAVFSKIHKIMFMKDYFIYKLTGAYACDDSVLNTTTFWNIRTREYWHEMLAYIGLDPCQLPKILPQGSNIGKPYKAVAQELGLSENTIINIGAQDQMCGALGVGNVNPGIISESLGSAMMVMAALDRLTIQLDQPVSCSPSAIHGRYMVNGYSTGAISMRWFRDAFCDAEISEGKQTGKNAYSILDEQIRQIPEGCDGLIMLPYLQGTGMPEPNDRAKGVYFGITTSHNKYHFARAIMEGVAMSLKHIIEGMKEKLLIDAKEIVCLSGGAKSKVWLQIQADITGLPIKVVRNSESTACFGATVLAGVACGIWKNVEEAMELIQFDETYVPNKEKTEVYEQLYRKFKALRHAVDHLF